MTWKQAAGDCDITDASSPMSWELSQPIKEEEEEVVLETQEEEQYDRAVDIFEVHYSSSRVVKSTGSLRSEGIMTLYRPSNKVIVYSRTGRRVAEASMKRQTPPCSLTSSADSNGIVSDDADGQASSGKSGTIVAMNGLPEPSQCNQTIDWSTEPRDPVVGSRLGLKGVTVQILHLLATHELKSDSDAKDPAALEKKDEIKKAIADNFEASSDEEMDVNKTDLADRYGATPSSRHPVPARKAFAPRHRRGWGHDYFLASNNWRQTAFRLRPYVDVYGTSHPLLMPPPSVTDRVDAKLKKQGRRKQSSRMTQPDWSFDNLYWQTLAAAKNERPKRIRVVKSLDEDIADILKKYDVAKYDAPSRPTKSAKIAK